MSEKERPVNNDCGGGDGGGGGEGSGGEDEDEEGSKEKKDPEEKTCGGCWRKGKRVSFSRWRKGKKLQRQRRKQKGVSVNSGGRWGRRVGGGCCLCLRKPRTVDSSGESPTSDPNSPGFTFDMLRTLLEKNDFYSKDCNPHFDSGD